MKKNSLKNFNNQRGNTIETNPMNLNIKLELALQNEKLSELSIMFITKYKIP